MDQTRLVFILILLNMDDLILGFLAHVKDKAKKSAESVLTVRMLLWWHRLLHKFKTKYRSLH